MKTYPGVHLVQDSSQVWVSALSDLCIVLCSICHIIEALYFFLAMPGGMQDLTSPGVFVRAHRFSPVQLFETLQTVAHQASLFVGFSQARTLE